MKVRQLPPFQPAINMTVKQEIFRVRRNYNKWVNNQTLEDYALRFTAKSARRWSLWRVATTALGAISFLALEAIGGAITLLYGYHNAISAILSVSLIIFLCAIPICYYAARYGVDIDLLTRGAGFGYIGSTATSLIYASFTFIFFALEAAIMARALELVLNIPLAWGYVISSIVVIPLVFYGITFISRFQLWTQPLWVILQVLPFVIILYLEINTVSEWRNYEGPSDISSNGINIFLFGSAAAVLFSLVGQIGEQVDFLRFLPKKNTVNSLRWWTALILAGPGWILIGTLKLCAGSFLAYLALKNGVSMQNASDPAIMYQVAFSYLSNNEYVVLGLVGIFVILSQLKINVTNAYAGSIAWSNFFSRLTHSHPGRVVWLVFNVAIALLLMELGVYQAFENTLSVYAIVAVAWVGSLVADLVINKPLGLSPPNIEFKRAYLHDINPVGIGSMALATLIGIFTHQGFLGSQFEALSHFVTLFTTFIFVPLIAILTKSKYYLARNPDYIPLKNEHINCSVCEIPYEAEDMAHCPAYDGSICSLCCSLDARCQDQCKSQKKTTEKIIDFIRKALPEAATPYVNSRLIKFLLSSIAAASICGLLLSLVYSNTLTGQIEYDSHLEDTLWKVFFIQMIVAGVIAWLFILAHESRVVAQEESKNQTQRLLEEVKAHEVTDKKLQQAKEIAEAANNAKSRYLTGLSHELRTPLNTILGYAQLLEKEDIFQKTYRHQIGVIRRSGEHLADLIEGLLDISKIETGRLDIYNDRIDFKSLLEQLVDMFQPQAESKQLIFNVEFKGHLPHYVQGDEKRVKQILINLLSNAINYTENGSVTFIVSYRNHVAEFQVRDTGVGIPESDLERIFRPFERVRLPGVPNISGTGLGLTISRLLADIMGGDLAVKNNAERGATFTLSLMLARVSPSDVEAEAIHRVDGYLGPRITALIVDDNASHRGLISDLLTPIGFIVLEAQDAENGRMILKDCQPDIYFIDRLMPGEDGLSFVLDLRKKGIKAPIVMVSANAFQESLYEKKTPPYDAYLCKPIRLQALIEVIGSQLNLEWRYSPPHQKEQLKIIDTRPPTIPTPWKEQILEASRNGHLSGLRKLLLEMKTNDSIDPGLIQTIENMINEVRLNEIIDLMGQEK